jgi:[ribosomal protein S18]-alanine N-acetyltransferase
MCGGPTRKFSGRIRPAVPDETKRPCRIRPFALGDADAVREIFRESPQAGALAKDSYERSPEWNGPLALVSESGGEITGFLMGREVADEAEVFTFAVAPKYRRQGHGGALVSAAIDGSRSRGVKNLFLEVRESNLGAIAFYERLGFSKIGYRKVYYRDPEEAAITMGKKLWD